MASLIRHTACEPPKPLWQNLLLVLGIALGSNVLIQLISLLPSKLAALASIALLVFAARLCSYVLNRKLAKYNYLLIDNHLIIKKQLGKRENTVLDIKIADIKWIKPIGEFKRDKKYKKSYYLSCRLRGAAVYICEYTKDSKNYSFVFQPNDPLARELIKQIKS